MPEIQITITTRFLERVIFIIIILILLFLLLTKYVSEEDCDCNDVVTATDTTDTTTTETTEQEDTSTQEEVVEELEEETIEETVEEPEEEEVVEEEVTAGPATSGELEVELGNIEFEIQESGAAKLTSIKVSVKNGLSDDALLFATIVLTEAGNQYLDGTKAYWDKVEIPLVKAGETKLVDLIPSSSYPPDLEEGDSVIVSATFEDFQGFISINDNKQQKV